MKIKIIIGLLVSLLLSSCMGVFVAGAAGGMVVYDSRSLATIEADTRIFYLAHKAIVRDPQLQGANIELTSFNRNVLLTGQAPKASQRVIAEKIVREVPNVNRVYDEIMVGQPLSYADSAQDSWITGEVRAKMLTKKGLESGSIRIVTHNKVVYLMGVVTPKQAKLAVDVARQTKNVNQVVKIFQYIRIE